MSRKFIIRYVAPWILAREEKQQRLAALRNRDGDDCRRCRRPMRFDLPNGHDKGPSIEQITPPDGERGTLDHLCLCHVRCNGDAADNTPEVAQRVRMKNEAALFSKSRAVAGRRA